MKLKLTAITIALVVLAVQLGLATEAHCYTKSINTPQRLQQTKYWCGAASAQMILECDTIENTLGRRRPTYPTGTITQIQQALYNDIQAHNNTTAGWYTDPDGLQWTLDHYDMVQTYVQYEKSDAAWSCKKLAWTIEHYEVPPAILVYEGDHWIVVVGMDTSVAPTQTGTYKINSFTVHDPWQWNGALGANVKIGYNNFTCKYFTKLDTGATDPWNGLRVSVCDPDAVTEDLIVPPPLQEGSLIGPQGALEAAEEVIEQHHLRTEPGFEGAFADTKAFTTPGTLDWPFCGAGPCYCVPYVKMVEDVEVVTAVIIVHGASGEFMEASYASDESAPALADFYSELTYPFITRESSARPGIATPAATLYFRVPNGDDSKELRINFQPADAVVPYACLADTGEPFGDRDNGYSYGWNTPNYETRDRDTHLDQRYDTLNHMQRPSNPHAVWEIAMTNGPYDVVIVCGDPSFQDQINNINIDGAFLLDPDPWDGLGGNEGTDYDIYHRMVEVADGRLTIEPGEGAVNAKICYVKIAPAPEPVCPDELIGVDIGGSQPAGSALQSSVCWDITAGGADIWGTADQFYYAYAPDSVSGDFTAVVAWKGRQLMPTAHEWAKAGIMIRQNLEPGSPHVMIVGTPGNGVALQGRDVANGDSWTRPLGGADWRVDEVDTVWLRLDRVGNTITGSCWSWPGGEQPAGPPEAWTASASHEVEFPFPDGLIGLATTSHEQGVPIEVSYTDLCIGPYVGPPVITEPELPDSPAGGDGYMSIREVTDNGEIRDQGACYTSLNSGGGSLAGHWKPVLNLRDSGGNGHFGNDNAFAVVDMGYREQGSVDDLSLIARGTIRIPPGQGGLYTFGVNSDDGFTLQLPGQNFLIGENGRIVNFESGAALQFYGERGATDTFGLIELPPGDHPFWLTYHEGGGEASVEFFAAKGEHVAFNPDAFRLVGDPGGLELVALRLISDVSGDGVVNYEDLEMMTEEWLAGDDLTTDLHPDGKIDFVDFGIFAHQWKQYVTVGLSSPAAIDINAGIDSVHDVEPRVATDGKGNWIVVWQSKGRFGSDSDILFSRSVNGGQTWSPVAALNSNASSDSAEDTWPRVAADGKKNWVVVWQSSGSSGTDYDILFSRSGDNSNSWSPVATLNHNAGFDSAHDTFPALAADGKGNWVVVWQGSMGGIAGTDTEIMYSHSGDDGVIWSYPNTLNKYASSDSASDMTPDVACDGTDWIAVWSSDYYVGGIGTDDDILFSRSITDGKTWGTAGPVNSNAYTDNVVDKSPEIAKSSGWIWVVVWQSYPSNGSDCDILLAQTQNTGLSWYSPELLNDYGKSDTADDSEPCIAGDGTGEMVTVWTTSGDPTWTIGQDVDALLSYSKDDGRNWSVAQPLNLTATVDTAEDWYPDIAGDGKGTWLAVWYSDNNLGGTGSDYDIFVTRFKLP
jgi:hypothetical protein